MPATFPTLGAADAAGLRGMFIADTHNDPQHIRALWDNIGKIRAIVKVVFLEAFFHNQNPGVMIPRQIQEHLTNRNFDWTPTLATDLYRVIHELASNGIDVQGIDSPLSSLWAPSAPLTTRRTTWRTSSMLNSRWSFKVTQYMATRPDKRFAIFGGMEHGALLKQNGLPNLVCFRWTGANYVEF